MCKFREILFFAERDNKGAIERDGECEVDGPLIDWLAAEAWRHRQHRQNGKRCHRFSQAGKSKKTNNE